MRIYVSTLKYCWRFKLIIITGLTHQQNIPQSQSINLRIYNNGKSESSMNNNIKSTEVFEFFDVRTKEYMISSHVIYDYILWRFDFPHPVTEFGHFVLTPT